jgi:hypothetical protein
LRLEGVSSSDFPLSVFYFPSIPGAAHTSIQPRKMKNFVILSEMKDLNPSVPPPHAKLSSRSTRKKGLTMRFPPLIIAIILLATSTSAQSDKLIVTGKLTRIMAIGGETSGWAIELDPALTVNGNQVTSIEIQYANTGKLEALANKTVKAAGKLSNAAGVETGHRPILTLSSIKPTKPKPTPAPTPQP